MNRKNQFMDQAVRILIGLVFLLAALFRILNFSAAEQEASSLGLPGWTPFFVIVLELAIATAFLVNRFVKHASLTAFIFLAATIILGCSLDVERIRVQLAELFVFNATATDVFLHAVFLILVALIFLSSFRRGER